ncbi:MAG: copper homeostasis protein CutC [Bacteroidota bacterium]|nr:copper homeostasis protein CutC [Bacteroidota bacterium]
MKIIREACVENLQQALIAEKAGAERLELCDNLACGGTSNAYGVMKSVIQAVNISVMCMVRPRGGDFVYSPAEFESMKDDIEICRLLGATGVVSGVLLPNGHVDIERTKVLVDLCEAMSFTFHKAFDLCPNPLQAIEDVIKTDANRLLTSGQEKTAEEGLPMLKQLHSAATGRIQIVAAGKITHSNLENLQTQTFITEFHGKKIV